MLYSLIVGIGKRGIILERLACAGTLTLEVLALNVIQILGGC